MKKLILLIITILIPFAVFSQDDLLEEIDNKKDNSFEQSAFKGLKIVNFASTKMVSKKELYFVVSHRFSSIENGLDDFFGLDQAVTRLNFVYGLSDGFNIGISRSSFQKVYDASLKYRILRQKKNGFPFTLVGFHSFTINTALEKDNLPKLKFKHRLGYTSQFLISRKFSKKMSLQLIPTIFHENFVSIDDQENTQYAIGIGGRHKLSNRWSINVDYGLHLNRASVSPFKNPLSVGFDLETGGHVFQLHFTNSQPMNAVGFLGQANGDWNEGDIFFGFNLSRVF